MAIVPRANPNDLHRTAPLPGARNETRVSAEPVVRMAEGVQEVVQAGVDVYQREQDRVDTASYMEAQRAVGEWRNKWSDPNNPDGMMSYKGRDALSLRDTMLPDYDDKISEIARKLPSDRARQKFMEYANETRLRTHEDINRYATSQHDAYVAGQRKAYIETQTNSLVAAQLTDPERYKQAWASTIETIYADAAANGDSAEATSLTIANLQSTVHSGVIDNLLSTSPIAAMDYYTEHADQFQEADRAKVLRALEPLYLDARADEDADAAIAGGSFHTPTPRKPEAVQSQYASIAAKHGATVTSTTRSRAENEAVNGVPNSQHVTGTAADFRTRDLTDAQVKALVRDLEAAGFEVHDERENTRGTGPHIHAEMPGSGGTVEGGAAPDIASALERVQAIRDPFRRAAAERKVKARFEIAEHRRVEADRAMVESINTAVWTTPDPTLPLAKVIPPEAYAYAASKGDIKALEDALAYRATNPVRADNAEVVGPYLETMRTNPAAFATMDVMRNARHMTDATAKALVEMQAEIRAGKYDVSDFASENDQLTALLWGPLSMVGETTEAKKKRAPIEAAWYRSKAEWARAHPGKKMGADDRDKLIRTLRASFAIAGEGGTKGFEAFAMTQEDRTEIVAALAERGITNPTEQQIRQTYLTGIAMGVSR